MQPGSGEEHVLYVLVCVCVYIHIFFMYIKTGYYFDSVFILYTAFQIALVII